MESFEAFSNLCRESKSRVGSCGEWNMSQTWDVNKVVSYNESTFVLPRKLLSALLENVFDLYYFSRVELCILKLFVDALKTFEKDLHWDLSKRNVKNVSGRASSRGENFEYEIFLLSENVHLSECSNITRT